MTDPAVELVLDHCRAMIREAGREEIPVLCILRDEIVKGVETSPRGVWTPEGISMLADVFNQRIAELGGVTAATTH